jgi:hypothetical protein
LLATADGSLYEVLMLSEPVTQLLLQLQKQMQTSNSVQFNSVQIKGETSTAQDMVNLDIVMRFLEMPVNEQTDLADAVC